MSKAKYKLDMLVKAQPEGTPSFYGEVVGVIATREGHSYNVVAEGDHGTTTVSENEILAFYRLGVTRKTASKTTPKKATKRAPKTAEAAHAVQ